MQEPKIISLGQGMTIKRHILLVLT
jgi:hypothetical protein